MDLVDRKALRRRVQKVSTEAWKMKMTAQVETVMNQFLDFLEQAPSVDAVPLDRLCEWLAEQDYEIYCFMCQEAFDTGGGCPNQVSDSQWRCGGKEHWKAFLTKVMEG